MKLTKSLLAIAAIGLSLSTSSFAQLITSFNSQAFTDDTWTLTSVTGGSTLAGTENAGFLVYGTPLAANFTGKTAISITASVTTAPANGFKFAIFDSLGKAATASFDWASFTGGPKTVVVAWVKDAGFNIAAVTDWNLISGGSGTALAATLNSASATTIAVPEPSTYAAFSGLVVLGAVAYRRRKQQA